MKIIISHDVDHITFSEHLKDSIAIKFAIRSLLEICGGRIPSSALISRVRRACLNRWENLDEIMDFDEQYGIPATFFVGVANGLGLSYSLENAAMAIKKIESRGFETGVHGISFDSYEGIQAEYDCFKQFTKSQSFGIRTHYLRTSPNFLDYANRAGYVYDASDFRLGDPCLYNGIISFPLNIMDGRIIESKHYGIQKASYKSIINNTIKIIKKAKINNQQYLTILFHDRYFSDEFPIWKKWFIEIVQYLNSEGYDFVNYFDIMQFINGKVSEIDHSLSSKLYLKKI